MIILHKVILYTPEQGFKKVHLSGTDFLKFLPGCVFEKYTLGLPGFICGVFFWTPSPQKKFLGQKKAFKTGSGEPTISNVDVDSLGRDQTKK